MAMVVGGADDDGLPNFQVVDVGADLTDRA